MTFKHCTHYELTAEERMAIAQTIDLLTDIEREMNDTGTERMTEGARTIVTYSDIDSMVDTLHALLEQDEEEVYLD